jgi:wyosine [tRNA(Phe)-imidazoG37] synthetase (radical SAM superfamily)
MDVVDECIYGPVPSRRLGRSLGIDLVPLKTCSYDCIYCQLGRTTRKTVRRRRDIAPEDVLARLQPRLATRPDVISIAGSGEPTLYEPLGELIAAIKSITDVPVVVITNGSLLGLPEVQRSLASADIVVPSLDAPDAGLWARVNRPHADLTFAGVVDGVAAFRESFEGEVWLEVMVLEGLTSSPEVVSRIATLAARVAPDRVQLNTAVRPSSDTSVTAVHPADLERLAGLFRPAAEIIGHAVVVEDDLTVSLSDVLALLRRRPCSVADIAAGLGAHQGEIIKLVTALLDRGAIRTTMHNGHRYYAAATTWADRAPRKETS